MTTDVTEYRADCELCPVVASTFTEDEYAVLDLDGREPFAEITMDGDTTTLTDLCPNCQAFIRDRVNTALRPLTLARRFTAKDDAPQPTPPADPSEDPGEAGDAAQAGAASARRKGYE